MSCLQIGFYLSSWGMMRDSFLLGKSVRNFSNLIITISKINPKLWEIDVPDYNEENVELLLGCKQQIIDAFGKNSPTDTLITKIMLGVFANVPTYDGNFRNFLGENKYCKTFNETSLKQIRKFYLENKKDFDFFKIYTLDFLTAHETNNIYTKAKLIDMCGFIGGR